VKSVTLFWPSGESRVLEVTDESASLLGDALAGQNPCYLLTMEEDGSLVRLNTRQLAAFAVEDGEPSESDTPEEAPSSSAAQARELVADNEALRQANADLSARVAELEAQHPGNTPDEDTRTVAELKDALDAGGVEYDSHAKKADLLELAKTNNL
jgi:HeH/LEM domain